MNVMVLRKMRDLNGVVINREWEIHEQSTYRVEDGIITIYRINNNNLPVLDFPMGSYAIGEWVNVKVSIN